MTTTVPGLSAAVNAVEMIREDHRRIKSLFREFEAAGEDIRPSIAERALEELDLHTAVEESHFYPSLRKVVGVDDVLEAREAHHAAKLLMLELRLIPSGRRYNAKFKVLADSVLSHIKEEESRLLPAAESSNLDLEAMGRDMALMKYRRLGRKQALEAAGGGAGLGAILAGAALAGLAWWLFSSSESEA